MNFEFRLDEITVPYYRLGFFGLSLFKDYDFSEKKFCIIVDEQENKISININDDGGLPQFNEFIDGLWGNFENGYATPFGYVDNELDVGIYSTACAHKGFTQLFIPSGNQKTKRGWSLDTDVFLGQLEECSEEVSKPFRIKIRAWTSDMNKEIKGEIKTRIHVGLPSKNNKVLANSYHPAFGLHNTVESKISNDQAILLAFSSLGYAYVGFGESALAIGMDADSISQFYNYFNEFTKYRFEIKNKKGMAQISDVDWQIAAGLLAYDLCLENDKIYNVVFKDDNGTFSNWLDYSEKNENIFSTIWECGSAKIAENDRASIYELKSFILRSTPKKTLNAYTQIFRNINLGAPWYADFYWLASMNTKDIKKGVLIEIFNKMGDKMEKEIRDRFKSIIGGIVRSKQGVKYPYKYALEFSVKQNLRTVVDKATLMNALAKIFVQAGFGFTSQQMQYLDSLNACYVRDLLITSAYTLKDKVEELESETEKE